MVFRFIWGVSAQKVHQTFQPTPTPTVPSSSLLTTTRTGGMIEEGREAGKGRIIYITILTPTSSFISLHFPSFPFNSLHFHAFPFISSFPYSQIKFIFCTLSHGKIVINFPLSQKLSFTKNILGYLDICGVLEVDKRKD